MATSFNYNSFRKGNIAINGLGQEVKFIAESRGKMMVSVKHKFGRTETIKMNLDGTKYSGTKTSYDLILMEET